MTWIPPMITGAQFKASVNPGTVSPLQEALAIVLPLNFGNLSYVNIFRGAFTPANDYLYLFQNLPVAQAPNFLIVTSDGLFNLSRAYNGGTQPDSISRFQFQSWPIDPNYFLASAYIEGRTNVPFPMAQGVPVHYTVVVGRADIL